MNNILQKNLVQTFGLDGLTDEEKATFLDELGTVVLETALVRFMTELSDEQVEAFDYYLETEPTPDALMEHLLKEYESFEPILKAAITEVKEDAVAVLGEPSEKGNETHADAGAGTDEAESSESVG